MSGGRRDPRYSQDQRGPGHHPDHSPCVGESAQETLNLGIDEYVQKPFEDIMSLAWLSVCGCTLPHARVPVARAGCPTRNTSYLLAPMQIVGRASPPPCRWAIARTTPRTRTSCGPCSRPALTTWWCSNLASFRDEVGDLPTPPPRRFPDVPLALETAHPVRDPAPDPASGQGLPPSSARSASVRFHAEPADRAGFPLHSGIRSVT